MSIASNLIKSIERIESVYESDLMDWESKYDCCFALASVHIYKQLDRLGMPLDYYDPDGSYQQDVTALVNALRELKSALIALG